MAFFLEPGGRGSPRARACGGVLVALLASVAAASCGSDGRPERLIGGSSGASGATSTGGAAGASSSGSGGDGGSVQAGAAGAAGGGSGAGSGGPGSESCAPAQPCQRLCGVLGDDPSGCGLGTAAECGCKCEERFNGPCPDELGALVECIGDTPSLDCKVRGRVFPGCETQAFALEVCDFQAREQLCALSYPLCTPYCQGAMLGFCSLGPESVASCLCGCEATLVTTCATAFDAFMTCTSNAPAFQCDGLGRLTATSCPTQWQALEGCMGTPGNVNSDAGG